MQKQEFIVKDIMMDKEGFQERRFVLADPTTGEVIDDAQGYGYKTSQNAMKAGWYKFKGGKDKMAATRKQAKAFWRANPAFAKELREGIEACIKEIALGEILINDSALALAESMDIKGFSVKFLDYLDDNSR